MENNRIKNLPELFLKLDITDDDSLINLTQGDWKDKTSFPSRINRILEDTEKWSPQYLFYFDNKPLILFFENPSESDERCIHKAVWNFNETPIVIILKPDSVNIYNGFAIDENTKWLKKLGNDNDATLNDFKYFELVTGKTFEKYSNDFAHKNRVDYKLLQNIEDTQKILCTQHGCSQSIANALLGKVIFIRYLIDRKVTLKFNDTAKQWTNDDLCSLLQNKEQVYSFFEYLQDKEKGFNGDLFPIDKETFNRIPQQAFDVLRKLLESEDIASGQKSLFQLYDFSVLPIEFISNVYEKFIGKENQANAGAYYTPTFLVDYIVKETVCAYLDKTTSGSCKVLDPACGSGIFLVETLRKIIEKNFLLYGKPDNGEELKTLIKRLAKENIFGIDKDESAIQVAIFSVYLTLLDYQKPAEIENFKFPILLGCNFFAADFFDREADYNSILNNVSFNFIIGNPPWAGGKKGLDNTGKNYIEYRNKKEAPLKRKFNIGINNNEIAEGFVFRTSDFCNTSTRIAFIIRSSILYNLGYTDINPFRAYWLQDFFIDKIFELAPVRHEVFNRSSDSAIAPAAIIFYRYANGMNTDKNILEHVTLKPSRFFSLFKIFSISRNDYKQIQQNMLKQYDWLWKTLVYGSYLDFNFLNRLKETYPTIKEIIADKKKFVVGTGIQYSNNPLYNAKHLIGKPFISSRGIDSFLIYPDKILKFDKEKVHRIRNEKHQIFKAPMLLIRKGLDLDKLIIRSVVSKQDLLFKDSLTSIAIINSGDIDYLYNIQAIFSTDILCYYAINIFAFIGIEREQTQNYDKYRLPYLELDVKEKIKEIERISLELYKKGKNSLFDDMEIEIPDNLKKVNIAQLNDKVLQKLNLSDCEKALMDYAINVSRFMFNINLKNDRLKLFAPIEITDTILQEYAQLYINRFSSSFNNKGKRFIVEIWYTKQIIGMFFRTIDERDFIENIKIENQQTESEIIQFIIKLGGEQITNRLFIQKDIRGFEKDCFYVIKPNEKRLWHKAIGYLDVDEFADAILRTERDIE